MEKEFSKETTPNFLKLWELYNEYTVYAKTTRDIVMRVWNGEHPVSENTHTHTCIAGTKVLVWMVSRFGDVGITDNLVNARGYNARVDADIDLTDFEFIEL